MWGAGSPHPMGERGARNPEPSSLLSVPPRYQPRRHRLIDDCLGLRQRLLGKARHERSERIVAVIRFGDLEVPRGAIAQLVVALRDAGESRLADKLGRAIDGNADRLVLAHQDYAPILRVTSRNPIPVLEDFTRLVEERSGRPRPTGRELEELRQKRLAANEVFFRELNEKLEKLDRGSADTDVLTIVCECADPDCAQRIELDHGEYETARSEPTRFVVAPGHVEPEIEEVISRTERFELVRKVGVGREVATRLDSTSAGDSDPPGPPEGS